MKDIGDSMVESIKELRKVCQPPIEGSVFWVGYLRKISIYFTKLFLIMGMSANQASLIQIILSVISFIPLLFLNWVNVIISAIILNASYLMDHVDGEIARYRGPTYYGRLLDILSHDIFYMVFIFIGFGLYFQTGNIIFPTLGFSASFFKTLLRTNQVRFEYLNLEIKSRKKNGRAAKLMYDISLANFFLPIIYILALLGFVQYLLWFYGLYMPLYFIIWVVRKRAWLMKAEKGNVDEKEFWENIRDHV